MPRPRQKDPNQILPTDIFVDRGYVAAMFGFSVDAFENVLRRPEVNFPRPIWVGPRSRRWRLAELEAYRDSLLADRTKLAPTKKKAAR